MDFCINSYCEDIDRLMQAIIVDDNNLNSEILDTVLRQEGIEPIILDSPIQLYSALEQVSDLRMIFLDLEFPNHDGFSVHQKLQSDPRVRNVPIIAYSVHTSEIDVARQTGFHSFIGKPINPDDLPGYIDKILNGKQVWVI